MQPIWRSCEKCSFVFEIDMVSHPNQYLTRVFKIPMNLLSFHVSSCDFLCYLDVFTKLNTITIFMVSFLNDHGVISPN